MAFRRGRFSNFFKLLREMQSGADGERRIIVENFLLEERLNDGREDSYGEDVIAPSDADSWLSAHDNYLFKKVNLTAGMPETFSVVNRPNLLGKIDEDQYLVRIEELS